MTESPPKTPDDASGSGDDAPGSTPARQVPVAFEDKVYLAAVVDLLGAIAYGEMSAFERLAEDAKMAPELQDKADVARMASTEFGHFEGLRERLVELGADPFEAMAPFQAPFDAFHARTAPSDWLEGLVKAYVGDGLAADFYREIAAFVDSDTRNIIIESLSDAGQSEFVVERDALTALLAGGVDRPGMDLAAIGRLFARLTENHSKRMENLGLSA
jgi:1,2-phenylacetyl-CoA epoxidase catalytic subunit